MSGHDRHLDLDALADLLAGEGDAAVVRHLESCARCAGELAALADAVEAGVEPALAALAAAPVPPPPAGLEARLAEALAAAPAVPVQDPGQRPAVRLEHEDEDEAPVVPLRAGPRSSTRSGTRPGMRPRGAGLLGVAAGAAGLLVAGALGLALVGGSGTATESTADSGAAGQAGGLLAQDGPVVLASGTDYRPDPDALRSALPGLLAAPGRPVADAPAAAGAPELDEGRSSAQDAAAATSSQESAGQAAPGSGTEDSTARGTEDSTAGGTGDSTAGGTGDSTAGGTGDSTAVGGSVAASGVDPLERLREPEALAQCLAALAGDSPGADPAPAPLALDYATSEGQPALVVVLPAPGGLVDISAVGPGCSAQDPQRLWSLRLPR